MGLQLPRGGPAPVHDPERRVTTRAISSLKTALLRPTFLYFEALIPAKFGSQRRVFRLWGLAFRNSVLQGRHALGTMLALGHAIDPTRPIFSVPSRNSGLRKCSSRGLASMARSETRLDMA